MISWLFALAFLYLGVYWAYPSQRARDKSEAPNRRRYTGRNLAAGVILFLLLDAAIFRTPFYRKYLKPDSYGGDVEALLREESLRPKTPRDIAVLGDSRMVQGFSARIADEVARNSGAHFTNLAVYGALPRVWYYLLREIDPGADRYSVIVLPLQYSDRDDWQVYTDQTVDLKIAAPLLRPFDVYEFTASYTNWSNKCAAVATCLLGGFAYRDDVADFVFQPRRRWRELREKAPIGSALQDYSGQPKSLIGLNFDPVTKAITFPPGLKEDAQEMIEKSVTQKPENDGLYVSYRRKWINRILDRYTRGTTSVVFFQLPRGPLGGPPVSPESERTIHEFYRADKTAIIDPGRFRPLERPEFFYDGQHLNAAGRRLFSEELARDLLAFRFTR